MAEEMLDIALIKISGGTQSRVGIDQNVVEEYNEALQNGATFPPVDVYYDGKEYWLADGFHRYWAVSKASLRAIKAIIHQGTRREAILHSVGANAAHGLRRSNADKHRAVEVLLRDPEWQQWSDREIARRCGVSQPFVGKVREGMSMPPSDNGYQMERTVHRNGTTFTQKIKTVDKPATEIPSLDTELAKSRKEQRELSRGDFLIDRNACAPTALISDTDVELNDSSTEFEQASPDQPASLASSPSSPVGSIHLSVEEMLSEVDPSFPKTEKESLFHPGDRVRIISSPLNPEYVGKAGVVHSPLRDKGLFSSGIAVLVEGSELPRGFFPEEIEFLNPHQLTDLEPFSRADYIDLVKENNRLEAENEDLAEHNSRLMSELPTPAQWEAAQQEISHLKKEAQRLEQNLNKESVLLSQILDLLASGILPKSKGGGYESKNASALRAVVEQAISTIKNYQAMEDNE